MQQSFMTLVAIPLVCIGLAAHSYADGLITKLPADGTWAAYDVMTTNVHRDGSRTESTGTLTVRSIGRTRISRKEYRWLEFEHSWEQEPTDGVSRRYHSSIQKVAIDESVFSTDTNPTTGILTGFVSKTSADEKPIKWEYARFNILKPELGSKSGFGPLDYYTRVPFDHATDIGRKTITVAGETLDCIGIEQSETTHKLGTTRQNVTTAAYRRWSSDNTPFGVVNYHFEILRMDGTSFEQQLTLKSTGENAITSLPNAK